MVLKSLSLTKWFFIQISIIHDNILSQIVDKRMKGFGQQMNSIITHYTILVHLLVRSVMRKITIAT